MNRRLLATLIVVSATVLAGCGAFGGAPSPTATPTDTEASTPVPTPTETATPAAASTPAPVPVAGNLSVDATLVWERVESLFPGEYEPPLVSARNVTGTSILLPFATHLGLGRGGEAFAAENAGGGYVRQEDRVLLLTRNGSATELERILAHEFVHAIQDQIGLLERADDTESFAAERAIVEGSAVYVENFYTREFLRFSSLDRTCAEYANGTPYARYVNAPYCYGGQYFAARLDSPSELSNRDLRLPNTTEQVLHPEATDSPSNLTVTTGWEATAERDRQGELFVRTALGTELPEERAIEAAAGWGNDRLVSVTGDTEGYVWVLRWDTDADAAEFETAFADYLDARGNRTADGWRVDDDRYRLATVDDRTVAVVTGNDTFVDSVSVTGESGNVTIASES
ncbi:hypothetical protein [Halolamina sp. C58]|uniref:hypothetical protein n=1 Tax=Halolamina sp. C58 TaxID=3421640 RepID=UPI003EB9F272